MGQANGKKVNLKALAKAIASQNGGYISRSLHDVMKTAMQKGIAMDEDYEFEDIPCVDRNIDYGKGPYGGLVNEAEAILVLRAKMHDLDAMEQLCQIFFVDFQKFSEKCKSEKRNLLDNDYLGVAMECFIYAVMSAKLVSDQGQYVTFKALYNIMLRQAQQNAPYLESLNEFDFWGNELITQIPDRRQHMEKRVVMRVDNERIERYYDNVYELVKDDKAVELMYRSVFGGEIAKYVAQEIGGITNTTVTIRQGAEKFLMAACQNNPKYLDNLKRDYPKYSEDINRFQKKINKKTKN